MMEQRMDELVDFWFGLKPSQWWRKDPDFDAELRRRFEDLTEAAARGELAPWEETPRGALALVIALDQLPRNMYRGTPRAFANDAMAQAVCLRAVDRGLDQALPEQQRSFLYMPLMHAEDLARQRRGVELFATLDGGDGSFSDYARRHMEIVERFGRFPHRNAILGRESTPEEIEFLKQPGSSF